MTTSTETPIVTTSHSGQADSRKRSDSMIEVKNQATTGNRESALGSMSETQEEVLSATLGSVPVGVGHEDQETENDVRERIFGVVLLLTTSQDHPGNDADSAFGDDVDAR